ncbi:sensor histidine kinase [Paenibacillus athensensis]|uniref:histidine kinase n=1 Tax=Paenibacillus athensensis TaxID=1967502 RepID=A0A4Y8Q1S0_9BACL|nr:sensor histidine kinase [Paenibacillus athensensis]MCD1260988.1 sensor histidine kinase [Paenibacillus athensensis]
MIKNSIRNKLVLFLLAATLVPIVTSIIVTYAFTKDRVTEETIKTNSALISQGKTNLINYLNGVAQASLTIYTNDERYYTLQQPEINYLGGKQITSGLQVMSHSVKEIQQIYLYAKASDRSFLMVHDLSKMANGPYAKLPAFPAGRDVYFEPTHIMTNYDIPLTTYPSPIPVLSMHRRIINFPENRVLGELIIDLDLSVITSVCEDLHESGKEELYILAKDGTVIYGPDPAQWGSKLTQSWALKAIGSSSAQGSFAWNGDEFNGINLYENMQTDAVDWTIVKRIPLDVLYKNARQLTLINTLVLSLFLVIVIAATVFISIRFTSPIKKLIRYITKIQAGQMNAEIELSRTDELGILANRFHVLIQNLEQMVMREYRLELANKSNQLRVLQAQINPHFLNNALQSIGTLALQHNERRIYDLISSLAKMMRYSMNTHESSVTLRKELEHVKSYLELQKQRFDQQLEIEYDTEPELLAVEVPKMILQPIVENYFKHGFQPALGIGLLRIAMKRGEREEQPVLIVRVEDNGSGLSEDRMDEVRMSLTAPATGAEEGIGLCNVLSRLQLSFSDRAELTLTAAQPRGLIVTLIIPLTKEESS